MSDNTYPNFNPDEWKIINNKESDKKVPQFNPDEWKIVSNKSEQGNNYQGQEGFLKKLPRNILAGLANLGHSALNIPHDLGQNLEQQVHQFGKFFNKSLPLEKYGVKPNKYDQSYANKIPTQKEYNFAQMLGQEGPGTFSDKLIQKGVEYAPEILGANALLRAGLRKVPLTRRGATRRLNEARQLANEREIGALNVNPEIIEDTRQFLPNTLPYRNSLDQAHTREYQPLFNLQSDVGKQSNSFTRSLFASERAHGREGLATRNRLLDEIQKALREPGHHDIADLMQQGRNDYRRYMNFRPYRNAALIGAGAYAIPKNALINMIQKLWSIHNH